MLYIQCILYYALSAVGGLLLGWLLFGGKRKELDTLRQSVNTNRLALNDALTDLSKFKNKAQTEIASKDAEISKLKKSPGLPDIIAKAQESEIKHWKEKASTLEKQLKEAPKAGSDTKKQLRHLQTELDVARHALKVKTKKIEEQKLALANPQASSEDVELAEDYKELKKRFKKIKKKLKAQSKKQAEIKTVVIKESLDLDKLEKLLEEGKLTTKTKKVSKKKKKKKQKQKAKSDS